MVSADFACVLGILITELVINACKHAYAPDEPGEIEICLFFPAKSEFRMEVRDYGGQADDRRPVNPASIGTGINNAKCRQVDAPYAYHHTYAGQRFMTKGVGL